MNNLAQKKSYDSVVIAKYVRLSVDDAVTENLSIPNQRRILDHHIDGLEIPNAEILEMVDNGHSGTTMERPAVQELLELVRCRKVDIIIIKDFSRFSRNSLESGYYIEQVFPLYGVRLISVGDNFDSNNYKNNTGGIDVAFKFLMHEHYVQDLSKKVKSAKRIQMKKGENIVARAIYGYQKVTGRSATLNCSPCIRLEEKAENRNSKKLKGRWEPDEPAASIVRQIF